MHSFVYLEAHHLHADMLLPPQRFNLMIFFNPAASLFRHIHVFFHSTGITNTVDYNNILSHLFLSTGTDRSTPIMTSQAMVEPGHVTALSMIGHVTKKMVTYLPAIDIRQNFPN